MSRGAVAAGRRREQVQRALAWQRVRSGWRRHGFADDACRFDGDRPQRRVLREWPELAGGFARDLVDRVHALDHATEHRVAPTRRARIECVVVDHVDVELRGAAVRIVRACHCDGAATIAESVTCLVRHSAADGLFRAVCGKSAALDHEVADHAVEDRAVVMSVTHVLQEVGGAERRAHAIQFDRERPGRGDEVHLRGRWDGCNGADCARRGTGATPCASAATAQNDRPSTASQERDGNRRSGSIFVTLLVDGVGDGTGSHGRGPVRPAGRASARIR